MIVPTHILPKPQDTSIMQVVTTNKRAPHAAQTVHHAWLPKYPSPDAPASSSTAATNQAPIRRAPLISPNTRIPHSPDTRTQACVTCAQQQTLISYRVSSKLLHEDGERERERERETTVPHLVADCKSERGENSEDGPDVSSVPKHTRQHARQCACRGLFAIPNGKSAIGVVCCGATAAMCSSWRWHVPPPRGHETERWAALTG